MKNVSVRYILCFAFLTALTLVLLVWNINAGSVSSPFCWPDRRRASSGASACPGCWPPPSWAEP